MPKTPRRCERRGREEFFSGTQSLGLIRGSCEEHLGTEALECVGGSIRPALGSIAVCGRSKVRRSGAVGLVQC